MLYIIKNTSNDNIVVGRTVLQPGSELKTQDLEPFKKMVEKGYLMIKDIRDSNEEIYRNYIKTTVVKTEEFIAPTIESVQETPKQAAAISDVRDNFLNETIKQNIMESFFNFYIERNVSEKDLKFLKWFYKNVGFTSKVKFEVLDLIENADNYEDLAAVLLNNIYPELLEIYLIEKKEENKKDSQPY